MSDKETGIHKMEAASDHHIILQELKDLRKDQTREMNNIREDLKEVLVMTRNEHNAQMEEMKGWTRRIEQLVIKIEKDVIHAKNTAEMAKKEAEKNTNWQTWAARLVIGAVMLGLIGLLVNGAN